MKPKLITGYLLFFVYSNVLGQNKKLIELNTARSELQASFNPDKKISLNTACWYTSSQKAFGDADEEGWSEPGGKRKKMNIDFSASYQFNLWLQSDLEFNYAKEGLLGVLYHDDYISLESTVSITGGLSALLKNGFNVSLRYGILGDYPFYEHFNDNAIKSFIKDVLIGYSRNNFELAISAENIFIKKRKELLFQTDGIQDNKSITISEFNDAIGAPRFIKTSIIISF
jgi:hypothetical protein